MSRHRNVRNRAYSYDDDYYDEDEEYYAEDQYADESHHQYVYRRNSPSRTDQSSLFNFVEAATTNEEGNQQPLLSNEQEALVSQLSEIVPQTSRENLLNLLRSSNWNMETAVAIAVSQSIPQDSIPSLADALNSVDVSSTSAVPPPPQKNIISSSTFEMPIPKKQFTNVLVNDKPAADDNVAVAAASDAVITPNQSIPKEATKEEDVVNTKQSMTKAELRAIAEFSKSSKESSKPHLSMVVIGHVDAGKSTLMGHLLYHLGNVTSRQMQKFTTESKAIGKSSFNFAWVMDDDVEERSRGVTMDVGVKSFTTATKVFTLLDAPGHRDFIPKMIAGASSADVALLVVPASTGEFESSFEKSGQTKEHTILIRSLGVTQIIVAVNKMDTVSWSTDRLAYITNSLTEFLQKVGFKKFIFVPVSGLSGLNLKTRYEESQMCLLEAMDTFYHVPPRPVNKPLRMAITDVIKTTASNSITVAGRVFTGAISTGDAALLQPLGARVTVKSVSNSSSSSVNVTGAGDVVEVCLSNIDTETFIASNSNNISCFLCSISNPIKLVKKFQASIITMESMVLPIIKGSKLSLHTHSLDIPINVSKLISSSASSSKNRRPRAIGRNSNATIEIQTNSDLSICLEEFEQCKALGRFTLRDKGVTLAAGIVTKTL